MQVHRMPKRGQYIDLEEEAILIPYMKKYSREDTIRREQESQERLQKRLNEYRIMKLKEAKEK